MPELPPTLTPSMRQLQELVDEFEDHWNRGTPDLRAFVDRADQHWRVEAISELVRVDMERRLDCGKELSVQQYHDMLPQLRENPALAESLRSTLSILQDSTRRELNRLQETLAITDSATPAVTVDYRVDETKVRPVLRLGQYELVKLLGEGGFGKVYLARDPQTEHQVAIKVKDNSDGASKLPADFLQEAKSVLRLDHPNIVRLLHTGETSDGRGFIVYEFVDGDTLEHLIGSSSYTLETCVGWIAEIAEALDHAHKQGIVHRDVSARNIMIDKHGKAKLLDFGLARLDGKAFVDDRNAILGCVYYMSPEQASSHSDWATSQSDIFSLGSVLYHAITGRRPFDSDTARDIIKQIREATPAPPRSIAEGISTQTEAACLRALEKQPSQRYRTGKDFSIALRRSIAPSRTSGVLIAALVAFVLLGITIGAVAMSMRNEDRREPSLTHIAENAGPSMEGPLLKSVSLQVITDQHNAAPQQIGNNDLPLDPSNQLQLQWSTTQKGYGYILLLDHQGKGRIIYRSDEAKYNDRFTVAMKDAVGLAFFIIGVSRNPISEDALSALLREPAYGEPIDFEDAIEFRGRFSLLDDTRPEPEHYDRTTATKGDGNSVKHLKIRPEFKASLAETFDHFYGQILGVRLP